MKGESILKLLTRVKILLSLDILDPKIIIIYALKSLLTIYTGTKLPTIIMEFCFIMQFIVKGTMITLPVS